MESNCVSLKTGDARGLLVFEGTAPYKKNYVIGVPKPRRCNRDHIDADILREINNINYGDTRAKS
jgi:hypothetical protein